MQKITCPQAKDQEKTLAIASFSPFVTYSYNIMIHMAKRTPINSDFKLSFPTYSLYGLRYIFIDHIMKRHRYQPCPALDSTRVSTFYHHVLSDFAHNSMQDVIVLSVRALSARVLWHRVLPSFACKHCGTYANFNTSQFLSRDTRYYFNSRQQINSLHY